MYYVMASYIKFSGIKVMAIFYVAMGCNNYSDLKTDQIMVSDY